MNRFVDRGLIPTRWPRRRPRARPVVAQSADKYPGQMRPPQRGSRLLCPSRRQLVSGLLRMDVRHAAVARFSEQEIGHIGRLGLCMTFVGTVTIIPFMPGGWDASAGGFPAMTGNVPFLMKDVVLLAVSFYLLKQDVQRVVRSSAINQRRS